MSLTSEPQNKRVSGCRQQRLGHTCYSSTFKNYYCFWFAEEVNLKFEKHNIIIINIINSNNNITSVYQKEKQME